MSKIKLSIFILLLLPLMGCTPVLLFSGVTGAGATLSKEKTVGSSVDDYNIWTKIKAAFLEHHKEIENVLTNVSVEVSEGRVLLTGFVNTAEERLIILKLVWKQNGVREVINEIKLKGEVGNDSIKQYGSDSWITAQVKSKMLLNDKVRSINYTIETIHSVVYILGVARNHDEFEAIKNIAESVKGVEKFVSYIKVKSEREIKQQDNIQVGESKEEDKVLSKGSEIDDNMEPIDKESVHNDSKSVTDKESTISKESAHNNSKSPSKPSTKVPADDDIEIEYVNSEEDM